MERDLSGQTRTGVFTALLVTVALAVVPSASAACAWVLWQEHRNAGTSWEERTFLFEQAFTDPEECEKRRGAANAIAANDNDAKAARRINDDGIRRFYQCAPDTIDPRGPK